jgi:hypothetical protein
MSTCDCWGSPSEITFDSGVALLRCLHCGAQAWTLDGREIPPAQAHRVLRASFREHRDLAFAEHRQRVARGEHHRRVRAPQPAIVDLRDARDEPSGADLQSALDQMLAAKGIPNTWHLSA